MTYLQGVELRAGPVGKQYQEANQCLGVVVHSMEGSYAGALTVLDDESGTISTYRAASWQISVLKDGRKIQHYPIESACFQAGSRYWNVRLVGVECEGAAGEPLTPQQVQSVGEIITEIAALKVWTPSRAPGVQTLYEHNELLPPGATQCPSHRIPWQAFVAATEPVGPYQATLYKGWDALAGSWYWYFILETPNPTQGPHLATTYEGVVDGQYRWRIDVQPNWPI